MTGRYVYPRGTCPRCGGDHALIKDLSRTIVHCCESRGDDIGAFNRGNGFQVGVEMGTGAIVCDPYGEAARARAEIAARPRLTAAELHGLAMPGRDSFNLELLDGIPHVGGRPVDPAAFRAAMQLLEYEPGTYEPGAWPTVLDLDAIGQRIEISRTCFGPRFDEGAREPVDILKDQDREALYLALVAAGHRSLDAFLQLGRAHVLVPSAALREQLDAALRIPPEPSPPRPLVRYRWDLAGGHVHVRVFVGQTIASTFALAGTLVFDEADWPAILDALTGAAPDRVQFVEERGE